MGYHYSFCNSTQEIVIKWTEPCISITPHRTIMWINLNIYEDTKNQLLFVDIDVMILCI